MNITTTTNEYNEMTSFELMNMLVRVMNVFTANPGNYNAQEISMLKAEVQNRINAIQAKIDEKAKIEHQAMHKQIEEDIASSAEFNKSIEVKFYTGDSMKQSTKNVMYLHPHEFRYCPECGNALDYKDILKYESDKKSPQE